MLDSTTVLAESSASCFEFTARLVLLGDTGDTTTTTPLTIRGMRWRLEVDGPPEMPASDEVTASLDAFTIRGDQANRLDLAALQWSGPARQISAHGPVFMPELHGEIRDGDLVRILAWIQTPRGNFGVEGIIFELRLDGDGPEALDPSALAPEECPTA